MSVAPAQSVPDSSPVDNRRPMSAAWAQEDLVRRLCLALDIAMRAIEFLAKDGYRDPQTPEDSFGPDKPIAETAMLLHVTSAVRGHAQVQERLDDLCVLLEPYARSYRTACAIALHPTICFQLAMPHILLAQLGLRNSRFDAVLALSAKSLAHRGREVVPHRALERIWLESLWTKTPPGPEFEAAALESVLNHPVDLLWGTREDAYAHTHTFMYFTDFGYVLRALPRPRSQILGETAGVLARSLLLEDYDLAAEAILAWPMTAAPWSPTAAFGFRVLAELEDKVGFLPAKNGVPEKFERLTGSERTRYALASSYHTAYIMGMLCALALRSGMAPPSQITGPLVSAELVDQLMLMIPDAETPWRDTFRQLQVDEQRALGPLLLDIAILANGRNHDFVRLGRLLDIALRHGLADAPLCAQIAELLERVAKSANSRLN